MHFPLPPREDIDWSRLNPLQINDCNGHAEVRFSAATGEWSKPVFVTDPLVKVHGLSPGLNYGMQAYEGLKAFRTLDGRILLFRADRHAKRFQHSAKAVAMPPPPEQVFLDTVNLAVAKNADFVPPADIDALLYIRPVLFASGPQIALAPPSEFVLCVYVQPGVNYHGMKPLDALVLEDFDRTAPKGAGNAKVGGNYAPVIPHMGAARARGFPVTLHLDSKTNTYIDEFSTSAFLGIKRDGQSYSLIAAHSKNAIDSVTSESCEAVAKSLGWHTERRMVLYEEIGDFSEVLAAGTAANLLPIKSIVRESKEERIRYSESEKEPGPGCIILTKTLADIQRGRAKDGFGWTREVTEPAM